MWEKRWHADLPRQISGLQVLYTLWRFFEVRKGDRTTFEISALISLEYWGDSRRPEWKGRWGYMVANLRRSLDGPDLETMYVNKIRKSEASLRDQVAHCDRQDEDHPDHSCRWLCRITDKIIEDTRRQSNIDAHIQGNMPNKPPKQPTAPVRPGTDKKPPAGTSGSGGRGKGAKGGSDTPPRSLKPKRVRARAKEREETSHHEGRMAKVFPAATVAQARTRQSPPNQSASRTFEADASLGTSARRGMSRVPLRSFRTVPSSKHS